MSSSPASTPPVTSVPPEWMQARKRAVEEKRAASTLEIAADDPIQDNWHDRWWKRFVAFAPTGYGLSIALHVILLVVLSLWIYQIQQKNAAIFLSAGTGDLGDGDITFGTDLAGGSNSSASEQEAEIVPPTAYGTGNDDIDPASLAEMMGGGGRGSGTGTGDGNGSGNGLAGLGVPTFAVTKGSFSIWTDPRDPRPGQNYHIMVAVKLPDHIKTYPSTDLTGTVVGTDGYTLAIATAVKRTSPPKVKVKNHLVTFKLFVPGASRLVRDTIEVSSKLLKEKQKIEIEF